MMCFDYRSSLGLLPSVFQNALGRPFKPTSARSFLWVDHALYGLSEPARTDPFLHPGKRRRVVWNNRPVSSRSALAHAAVAFVPRGLQMPPRLGLGDLLRNSTRWGISAAATSQMERALRQDAWLRYAHHDVELSGMI